MNARALIVFAAMIEAACVPDFESIGCYSDLDCDPSNTCRDQTCMPREAPDSGIIDAGDLDATIEDARPGPPVVDPCDDPNNGNDTWILVWNDDRPIPRDRGTMELSPLSREVILIGGVIFPGVVQNDVWGWNGSRWRQKVTSDFQPHADHAMAQDRYGNLVLFGGRDSNNGGPIDTTWIWDGGDMRELHPDPSPPARFFARLAYDSDRQKAVLFGGYDQAMTPLGDTWEWDGDAWEPIHTATTPPARGDHAMDFDIERGKILLYSGTGRNNFMYRDLWSYDGTNWTSVSTLGIPRARGGSRMIYDPLRAVTLLFGGSFGNITNETWELHGIQWTQIPVPSAVHGVVNPSMAFDAAAGRALIFSGWDGGGHPPHTWQYCPR